MTLPLISSKVGLVEKKKDDVNGISSDITLTLKIAHTQTQSHRSVQIHRL